jgi:hypothetical protein
MENDYRAIIQRADKDAVNLKDNADLSAAAERVQRLFDESSNLSYGRKAFLVNAYVDEANHHADDIYGKGQHIKLEIIDSNKNEHLDENDKVTARRSNGENASIHLGEFGGHIYGK